MSRRKISSESFSSLGSDYTETSPEEEPECPLARMCWNGSKSPTGSQDRQHPQPVPRRATRRRRVNLDSLGESIRKLTSPTQRRLAAVQELVRLLKKGGKALIYVWAMEQEYKKNKSKYLKEGKTSNEHNVQNARSDQTLPIHTNRTAFDSQDLLVPWHLKANNQVRDNEAASAKEEEQLVPTSVYHRYYHVFREGELEALCRRIAGITVQHSYHDQGNWCVVLEKL